MSGYPSLHMVPVYPVGCLVYTEAPADLELPRGRFVVLSVADGPQFSTGLYFPARAVGPFGFEPILIQTPDTFSGEGMWPMLRSERAAWEWIRRHI